MRFASSFLFSKDLPPPSIADSPYHDNDLSGVILREGWPGDPSLAPEDECMAWSAPGNRQVSGFLTGGRGVDASNSLRRFPAWTRPIDASAGRSRSTLQIDDRAVSIRRPRDKSRNAKVACKPREIGARITLVVTDARGYGNPLHNTGGRQSGRRLAQRLREVLGTPI